MDKETLSHYGWIVIVSLVLAVMIALSTPFGVFIGKAVSNTVRGFAGTAKTDFDGDDFDADQFELDYNKDKQEWEDSKNGTTRRNDIIPEGATYTKADGTTLEGNGTNTVPDIPTSGDVYEKGDYIYTYSKGTISVIEYGTEWSVVVKDTSKTSYGEILSEIAGKPVTHMTRTFERCMYLKTAPAIPSSITCMFGTFASCTSLTIAPKIPHSVTNMRSTFQGCGLEIAPTIPNSVTNMFHTFSTCDFLKTAPVIPDSVTDMSGTFYKCTSLTGTIEINANPTSYSDCLRDTQITEITGSTTMKAKILTTK